jgi:hypothetical protein
MRRLICRFLAGFITFFIGVSNVATVNFLFHLTKSYRSISSLKNTSSSIETSFAPQPTPTLHKKESVSPYEIKQYIAAHERDDSISLADYWNRMGIETEAWGRYDYCKAEIFKLQLDSETGNEVILRLNNISTPTSATRYLIYRQIYSPHKIDWQFLGYFDVSGYFEVPRQKVVTAGTHRWFVLSYLAGRGSAYGLDYDEWYEIGDHGIKKVLKYPSRKYIGVNSPSLETRTKIISATATSGVAEIKIQFFASYGAYDAAETSSDTQFGLWNKKQVAMFVKQLGLDEKFNLDTIKSNISSEEIENIYGGDSIEAELVIKYNYAELAKRGAGNNTKQKEWLSGLLDISSDTQEKERLQGILRH